MKTKPKKFKKVVKYDKFSSEDKSDLFTLSLICAYTVGMFYMVSYSCGSFSFRVTYMLFPVIMYCVAGGIYKILSRKVYWIEVKDR
ncbi:MAG: hypothetical protein ACTSVB_07885 [Candidatus Heimdallarchaeaceae archaeon]